MTTTMQERTIRAHVIREDGGDAPENVFRFRASTSAVARDGFSIPASAWEFEHFLNNPVVLFAHGFGPGGDMPIGRVSDLARDDQGLLATVEFDRDDQVAADVMRKLRGGFLNAVSVGFRVEHEDIDFQRGIISRAELLELSVVPVPSDPQALLMRQMGATEPVAINVYLDGRQIAGATDPTTEPDTFADLLASVRVTAGRLAGGGELADTDRAAVAETIAALEALSDDDDQPEDEMLDLSSLPPALRGLIDNDRNA